MLSIDELFSCFISDFCLSDNECRALMVAIYVLQLALELIFSFLED